MGIVDIDSNLCLSYLNNFGSGTRSRTGRWTGQRYKLRNRSVSCRGRDSKARDLEPKTRLGRQRHRES